MSLAAIPEIRVETAGDGVTYWLPVRPLGKIRWFGLIPIGFSVIWLSHVGHMLLDVIRQLSNSKHPGFEYFMAAFLVVFVVVGCVPAGFGLLIMFGRCRVRWRDGRLSVSDYVGLLGRRRRMPKEVIRKLTVPTGGATNNGRPIMTGPMAKMAMLVAEFETGKPRVVAMGYPREWMEAIASDLSARVGSTQTVRPQVEVIDQAANPPQFQDVAAKPDDSKVTVQRQDTGIILEVPPAGLRKGSMGLFFMACAWCLFMVVFTSVVVFGKTHNGTRDFWPILLFLCGFWTVGLGLMATAVNLGRRRATLLVENNGLTVVQTGLFGVKRREFLRQEIKAIRADASSVEVNHTRLTELQIHPVTGKKMGLLVGRDPGELRWMATELRKALGVSSNNN